MLLAPPKAVAWRRQAGLMLLLKKQGVMPGWAGAHWVQGMELFSGLSFPLEARPTGPLLLISSG